MRMLFYTAAAIAATLASLGQAIKIETLNNEVNNQYLDENSFSQIDAFQSYN